MSSTLTPQTIMVLDDHSTVLSGTIHNLKAHYPNTTLVTAETIESGLQKLKTYHPCLLLCDLSLPIQTRTEAKIDHGLNFLREVMETYPELHITVQSSYVKALVRLVHHIDNHKGGFTVADKKLPQTDMLTRIDWALQGLNHTKDVEGIRTGGAMRPEWYQLLELAFDEGLFDWAIADRMNVSERTVRIYWSKLYDVLGVYPEENRQNGQNIRIRTERRARELGLID